MFHAISAATKEVAPSAGTPAGSAHFLGYDLEINRFEDLFPKFAFLVGRVSTSSREFFIGASGIMADEAIDIFFFGKIKGFVFPPIACMTAGAPAPVGLDGNSEIVKDESFAEFFFIIFKCPGPVDRLLDLFRCLCVACEAGSGDFRACLEVLLHGLEFGMIRGGCTE